MRSERFGLVVLLLVGALLGGGPRPARASCASSGPLPPLWTYPESGMKDVPTNAVFWTLTGAWGVQPMATLNGASLEALGTGTFGAYRMQPAQLEPNHDYVLVLDYYNAQGLQPGAQTRFEIAFTTGQTPAADTPEPPHIARDEQRVVRPSDTSCADVIGAQDCFDTGQDTLVRFDVDSTRETLGWLVRTAYEGASNVWPARCGQPGIYLHGPSSQCFHVQRIGAGGRLSAVVDYCAAGSVAAPGGAGGTAGVAGVAPAAHGGDGAHALPVSAGQAALVAGMQSAGATAGTSAQPSSGCAAVRGVRAAQS
jgi:hypothetical protein